MCANTQNAWAGGRQCRFVINNSGALKFRLLSQCDMLIQPPEYVGLGGRHPIRSLEENRHE